MARIDTVKEEIHTAMLSATERIVKTATEDELPGWILEMWGLELAINNTVDAYTSREADQQ